EDAPAPGRQEIFRACRIWNAGRVEAVTLIGDANDHPIGIDTELDPHRLRRVALVAVEDRVRDRFGNTNPEVELETRPLERAGPTATDQVTDGGLDDAKIARKLESDFEWVSGRALLSVGRALLGHRDGER